MMVFMSIYGVVDGLFVSNIAGKTAFASINLIMPFTNIIGGMGFMVGTGGTALVSKVLGEGRREVANRYFTMMAWFIVIMSSVLSAAGIIFMPQVSRLLGATDAMINDCVVYGRIVIAFTMAFMFQNMFQSFFVAAEKPKLGLLVTVIAGITNIVLDALFVAVLGFGVAGAAVATGISQVVGAVIPLIYFIRPNGSLLRITKTRLELKPILRACGNGSSELMTNISSSVVSMLYNFQLLRVAGENGVSAYGVLMYVQFIFIAIFIGYAVGCAPIVAFNYGAENHRELNNILKKSLYILSGMSIILTLSAIALSHPLSAIFVGYDKELFEMTKHAFSLFSLSFILVGFNIFTSSFFTSLNNGVISAVVAFFRTLIFQSCSVILLPMFFDIDGIWWSITLAEVLAFILSVTFLITKNKKYGYFLK